MKVSKFPNSNYGCIIDGLDLDHISDEQWFDIGQLHLKNLVTVVRGSHCRLDKFSELIHKLGPEFWGLKYALMKKYRLDWATIQTSILADLPNIEQIDKEILDILYKSNTVTKNGKSVQFFSSSRDSNGDFGLYGGQELDWHMHSSGKYVFEPAVSLLAADNTVGTATGFVTTADYYESVSNSFRSELDDMVIIHRYKTADVDPPFRPSEEAVLRFKMCPVDDIEIPMVIQSPGGIKGLHYSTNTFYRIKGSTEKESQQIFNNIDKELFIEKNIYDHWYQQEGDFIMFDNTITLHRRVGMTENRKIYRIEHTYDYILNDYYEPFLQAQYQKLHRKTLREVCKLDTKIGFKRPPFLFGDLL